MKRDTKPFVVEVKRGTRRSSFLGAMDQSSTMSEAQRRAEVALFSPGTESALKPDQPEPARRILRSLVEPEPVATPVLDDVELYAEPRRPRPVGRPRKSIPSESSKAVEPPLPPRQRMPPAPAAPVAAPPLFEPTVAAAAASMSDVSATLAPASAPKQRLRDRSKILARYVLGTEPAPGERWERSWRRAERYSRGSD